MRKEEVLKEKIIDAPPNNEAFDRSQRASEILCSDTWLHGWAI
jgi:hypothetical protein